MNDIEISFHGISVIIKDVNQKINLKHLNMLIQNELISRGDIYPTDNVNRGKHSGDYIIINSHASLSGNELINFIKKYLTTLMIKHCDKNITEDELEALKNDLPNYNPITNSYYGGGTQDTDTIEPYAIELCEVINSIKGLNSFASCNGHNGSKAFYVAFTAENLESLKLYNDAFTHSIAKILPKYNISKEIQIINDFSWGNWPDGRTKVVGTYFNTRIKCEPSISEKFYQFISEVSKEMKKYLDEKTKKL